MKRHRLVTALALVAVAAIGCLSMPAFSADDWSKWHPDYKSEKDLVVAAGDEEVAYLRKNYNLPAGFDAKQYGYAVAEYKIRERRVYLNLGPDFTSDILAAQAGAKVVHDYYKWYGVGTNFTSNELRQAKFLQHMRETVSYLKGLPMPFSYEDYVKATGAKESLDLASMYNLPTEWVYADLVAAAGPSEAAQLRRRSGFSKTATHAEIERAMGVSKARWFIEDNDMPAGFTAQQLALGPTKWSKYSEFAALGEFTEADLIAHFGKEELRQIKETYGLQAPFTEADLRQAMADKAIADMQNAYDLDAGFTEADIRRAAGLSKAAGVRRDYKLRQDFTAGEYQQAYEKQQKSWSSCLNNKWEFCTY